MQLRSVDLNLLIPLRALLEERSVSRAAERMHMSQPALSAALARLRRHFGDDLLERRGNSYELTPLAAQLLERSRSAAQSLDRVFSAQAEFEPSACTREFAVFSSDYGMAVLGGALTDVLREAAPLARVRFHNMSTNAVVNAPDSLRDDDGLFMPHGYLDIPHQDMFMDGWVCIVAPGNPRVGESLQLEHLAELPWAITYSGQSEYTPAVKQMQLLGIEPRVEVVTPSFLALPSLIADSERIALVQRSLAQQMLRAGSVRVLECPFDVVPLRESFWWNAVHERDPEHVWFRSLLPRAVERAGLTPAI
ncbi:LysR family transcriptional regulator [Microbacterium sp. STN6]|uniref:LysR family transcriptional regulator n=1 Tax=Microbacterium sp. STN6 TaxID=2995588 RepID=UPI002260A1C8|nr:LysR family transcriptional regulator [Microbacterium sp. STN6]MCX7522268.1 LysR family transcriptional regulator [Microbacterium sp. STN6]